MKAPSQDVTLAILYDWHNRYRLRRQNMDIGFWSQHFRSSEHVLVLGAGTGRVACQLVSDARCVVAVDIDRARLCRMDRHPSLFPLCANFEYPPVACGWDEVLFPYSTLQLVAPGEPLERALSGAARSVLASGNVWVDVSDSFQNRESHPWRIALTEPCAELGCVVTELQRGKSHNDHYRIDLIFRNSTATIAKATERWFHHPDGAMREAADRAGLLLVDMQNGYGEADTTHRRIYQFTRK